jgi:putative oxidoreductase
MSVEIIAIPRIVAGVLLAGHGLQKLAGWFGGGGIRGTAAFLEQLGFRPGRGWAYAVGLAETLGGASLALGFLTPLGAVLVLGVLVTAILVVHASKGLWNHNGGMEHPFVLASIALTTAIGGPGRFSVDAALGLDLPVWLGWLAAGIVFLGVLTALAVRARATPAGRSMPTTGPTGPVLGGRPEAEQRGVQAAMTALRTPLVGGGWALLVEERMLRIRR